MRVAIFAETYFPFISGVVTHMQTLKQGLEAAGHEVLIVTLNPKTYKHYVKDGVLYCPAVPLKKIYGYGVANPVNLRRLAILKKFNPDIIHIHTEFSMGIFAMFAARHLKKPMVYTLHTMYDEYVFYLFPNQKVGNMAKPAAHAYIRKVANTATEVIGPSHKVADYLRRCGVTKQVNIVPNTVDTTAFMQSNVASAQVQAVRDKLGIRDGDVVMCFVGRLGKEKSIDVLIDYFAAACKKDPRYKLFIIGAGPETELLNTQIKTLQLQDQVVLLGRIEHDDLPAYYQAAHLFGTASLTEMNSISLLEATASGLYAVTRFDEQNPDQVEPGQNGDVYTSSIDFARIVHEYAARTEEEKQQLRNNVSAYAARYGKKEFTQKVLEVYAEAALHYKA